MKAKQKINSNWIFWIPLAIFLGSILRLTFVQDMEYKEDEQYNFEQTQLIGKTQPWPWYGIPSGVYLVNPGMSIWVFAVLAKLFGIHQPTTLATAVQLFALLGMSLIIPFVILWIKTEEKESWLWALMLAMVNPFLVLYQRKLWPEPFLPFFTMFTLMGWWKKENRLGAFIWGMIGAWLGQIHMSGFFFSAALAGWSVLFQQKQENKQTRWGYWFLGSSVGALPLIPWLIYVIQHPFKESMSSGRNEMIQLKYWAFWFTDPLGLHLGNPLGLQRGPSQWDQISDFIRYPIVFGKATYLNAAAHLVALGATVFIFLRGAVALWKQRKNWKNLGIGRGSQTAFVQNSAFWGCGILLTLTGVVIRRYYMAVTFPLEFIFLIRMAQPHTRSGRNALIALWISELMISAHFVGYIHVNQGATQGDYGPAYHLVVPKKNDSTS
jgi:hypothetical protein